MQTINMIECIRFYSLHVLTDRVAVLSFIFFATHRIGPFTYLTSRRAIFVSSLDYLNL
jgi:hypothetical protein